MTLVQNPLRVPDYLPTGKERALFLTSRGTIVVELFGLDAAHTVGNFIELAQSGFYDGLKFHAYKEGSVVAGGCPVTRNLGPAQVHAAVRGVLHGIHPGTGDAGYCIADEWEQNARNRHLNGSLAMAHGSAANSASCQFYFSLATQPEFDKQFTVFGQAVDVWDPAWDLLLEPTCEPTLVSSCESTLESSCEPVNNSACESTCEFTARFVATDDSDASHIAAVSDSSKATKSDTDRSNSCESLNVVHSLRIGDTIKRIVIVK
ncbi:MAG: peptidylprolyl isomerase [Coriobacteriales bacterium]|jgi:peptidyl-prolyl cis-trans isomerase B (cyclophilin B)|nr:peptidylprolyl isomerase [Coriobacteriales bacterium]